MARFEIKITQILEGYTTIEADTLEKAIETADRKYNYEGHELPEMDDITDLIIEGVE